MIASTEILQNAADWKEEERWVEQAKIADPVSSSVDAREGAIAFAEKRQPVWRRD